MVEASEKTSSARFATAARRLYEGGIVDVASGRFSKTVFVVAGKRDRAVERCAIDAALKNGLAAVVMRPVGDACSTPRRANVALVHGGATLEVRDCVLWLGKDDVRAVLVPWDAREDCHFAIGPDGLERRAGRPAAMLGQGMSRAKDRLERSARALRVSELDPGLLIVTASDAA